MQRGIVSRSLPSRSSQGGNVQIGVTQGHRGMRRGTAGEGRAEGLSPGQSGGAFRQEVTFEQVLTDE